MNTFIFFPLFFGSILTMAGFIQFIYPPKGINALYGYRTSSSMKTKERWDFAQKYSSKLMIKLGLIYISLALFGLFLKEYEAIALAIHLPFMLVIFVILIYKTEKNLKSKFT